MEEFEGLSVVQLRKILIKSIIEAHGRDYTLGWLQYAYTFGNFYCDDNTDYLIDQIRYYRACKEATIAV
jgi:hypothetical protein